MRLVVRTTWQNDPEVYSLEKYMFILPRPIPLLSGYKQEAEP
jgi:hypothetical protein